MQHKILSSLLLLLLSFQALIATAQEPSLKTAVDAAIDSAIRDKRMVGCVVVVSYDGTLVYRRAAGLADRENNVPMQEDAIFRLASVTKAFTTVAAAALIEQGKLDINAPVTKYLPDFRPKLADGTEPVILIRYLMSHTAGLKYSFFEPKDGPYHKAGVSDGLDITGISLEENCRRIASCPLLFEPGTAWHYSLSPDVLGAVIAKVNGTTFQEAMKQLVTDPLKMQIAGFSIDKSLKGDVAKVPTPYFNGDSTQGNTEPVRMTDPQEYSNIIYSPSRIFEATEYPSGGGGMAATVGDVMLLLEAIRLYDNAVASKKTFQMLDEDQTAGKTAGDSIGVGDGIGFGLGWSVVVDPAAAKTPQSKGTVAWSGAYGHHWFVDRAKKLSVAILTNTTFEGMAGRMTTDIREAVYAHLPAELPPSYQVGDVEVVSIKDGDFAFPAEVFLNIDQASLKKVVPTGFAEGTTHAFLVKRNDGKPILIDTGYGAFGPAKPMLTENLAKAGVKPEDVSLILLTHLHSDHVGGLLDGDNRAFPNAKIQCSKPEYDFWTNKESLDKTLKTIDEQDVPFMKQQFELIGKIVKLYGEDFLPPFEFGSHPVADFRELTAQNAAGHTPGHAFFSIESKNEKLVIAGDFLHGAAIQFPFPQAYARFDMNPAEAGKVRKALLERVCDEDIPFAGSHLPGGGLGRAQRAKNDGYSLTVL